MSQFRIQDIFLQESYSQQFFLEESYNYCQYYPVDNQINEDEKKKNEENRWTEKILPPLKKSNPKISNKIAKDKKKETYMLPGESKNIPKNFTRALKNFILNHFDSSVQKNPQIKKFLATKPEKACKQTLQNSLQSCQQLKQIAKIFFGDLKWGTIFLEENKVDLEPYFRFNQIWLG
ncbi:unnamed protein product (macronuclear) [Paramecium tetraurelia]|uniref:Uncharacterized protein n=1 Tax=Paramecium tetraurelia TaxID=5888 RepID=A0DUJ4_PARTE|nr:uncharacterized protein GSPATT00020383001 [Paramecium tetraurelia]CAK86711.1 unnamed protein product [Paramecium tetraurelia]|eukprot:XP_001454108.1 hypothetical protein (macronuclear) [Paramecium tetraurelia strain d4-2]